MGTVVAFRAVPRQRYGQRQHRRVPLDRPVALVDSNGTVATAVAADISRGGIQARVDRYTADSLHVSERVPARELILIDAHLKLPLCSTLVRLDAECRLVYLVAAGDGDFLMGLQFLRFHYDGARLVERFVREAEEFPG